MAEAFFQVLIENVTNLIKNEVGSIMGVDKEMKKLTNTLTTIQKVLEDAEDKQFQSKAIQYWLSQLNDLAFEIEDILDECNTEFSKLKAKGNNFLNKLKKVLYKSKVGRRIKEATEKLEGVAKDRHNFQLTEIVVQQPNQRDWRRETGFVLNDPDHVYGREEERDKIVDLLVNRVSEKSLSVLPIIGLGGMGKTTLAAKALGGLLRFQRDEKEWVRVEESHMWNLLQEENSILPVLRLSYRHLPFVMKRCFAYCAIFPKDHKFDKTELIFHWMAHGCIASNEKREGCRRLSHMPYRIGELTSLKTLGLFIVGDKIGNQLDELEHLNLGGTLEIRNLKSVKSHFTAKKANLVEKPNLRDLMLCWEGDGTSSELMEDEKVLEALEPHPNLVTLKIDGFRGRQLALWMKSMKNITQIYIWRCTNLRSLSPLGDLPHLKSLKLNDLEALEYMVEENEVGCEVWNCPQLERRCEEPNGEDWHKISHIPRLMIGY